MNPLFPRDDKPADEPQKDAGFVLHRQQGNHLQPMPGHDERMHAPGKAEPSKPEAKTAATAAPAVNPNPGIIQPSAGASSDTGANPAVELIRQKVEALYAKEPGASAEIAAAKAEPRPRSKHEQFMYELSTSGKPLAYIQTAWHNYYVGLPENEKHEVWQEFYANNARRQTPYTQALEQQLASQPAAETPPPEMPHAFVIVNDEPAAPTVAGPKPVVAKKHDAPAAQAKKRRAIKGVQKQILAKARISEKAQAQAKRHLQSLVFGLSTGLLVLLVFLFGFFNEVIIAPFIQPSRHNTQTPVILTSNDISATAAPEVIIPKINVEIPVNYSLTSDDENNIENALEDGVVHYPSTVLPGQQGNAAFFGHSSNNIFNPGHYKFAFVLLHTLVPGDLFYLTYNGTVYTYQVYDKKIVSPSDVAVLDNVPGKTATATLITCDPPGTSLNRLVVWGEQISPDPSGNAAAATSTTTTTSTPTQLASNGPTLWSRFIHWVF